MDFWEYFGEKPAIYAPERRAQIDRPMTEIFRYCKWLPLPNFFYNRMREFILTDPKISSSAWSKSLASLAEKKFCGMKIYPDELALWAERYHGKRVGEKPKYDPDAQASYRANRQYRRSYYGTYPRSPNQPYFDWKERRDEAAQDTLGVLMDFCEYVLRHIVRKDDFKIEQRHKILEHMADELYKKFWSVASGCGSDFTSYKNITCTRQQWNDSISRQMPDYLRQGADIQCKVCKFTAYDFDAIANFAGAELNQMCAILEATAAAKIRSQLKTALGYLDSFNRSVAESAKTGAMRENKIEQTCNILKYRINISVEDTGKGVVFAKKASDMAGQAVGVGLAAAAVGAVVARPPLLGLAALGMAIFGGSRR